MDLKPLDHQGDISEQQFRALFESRLGDLFTQALTVLTTLGQLQSFSVANVIHLGLQKGIAKVVIEDLEKWCTVVVEAPDPTTAYVDTRQFFDIMYAQYFMTGKDTISGLGPFGKISERNGFSIYGSSQQTPSGLWVPSS